MTRIFEVLEKTKDDYKIIERAEYVLFKIVHDMLNAPNTQIDSQQIAEYHLA